MDFSKLTKLTRTTKAIVNSEELTVTFRGTSQRVQRELEALNAVVDRDTGMVKPPEYLAAYVVSLGSDGTIFTPDLDYWLDAEPELIDAVFEAVNEALLTPKSGTSELPDSSNALSGTA